MLTDAQIERYSRQIILPQIGGRGQERLLAASVAVVGTDRLAAVAAHYLAAAGVGVVCTDASIVATLAGVNPDCRLQPLPADMDRHGADALMRAHDARLDASGQRAVSALLNAASVTLRKPLIWARVHGGAGELAIFAGHQSDTACFECLQERAPTSHDEVLSETTAVFIGAAQATEAMKAMLGLDTHLTGRLMLYDACAATVRDTAVSKNPRCACCSSAARTRGVAR